MLGTLYGAYCAVYANTLYELYGEASFERMEEDSEELDFYFIKRIDEVINPILLELSID